MKHNIKLNYRYTFIQNLIVTGLWMLYLSQKGFNPVEIGVMEAIFHGTSFLFEVPSGSIGDRFGYRNTLIASRLMNILSCLLTVLSNNFWIVALGFAVSALSHNLATGTNEALVFESLVAQKKESQYIHISANINVLIELSSSLGIVIAGLLSDWFFDGVYWLQIVLNIVGMLLAFGFVEPQRPAHIQQQYFALMKSAFQLTREIPNLILVMLSFAFLEGLNATYYFYFQNYFVELGIAGLGISLLILISAVFQIIGAKTAPFVSKYFKMSQIFFFGFVALSLGIGLSGLLPKILVMLCYILVNTLTALLNPIRSNFINQLIPSGKRATMNSIDSLCFSLMMIPFFPIAGGLIYQLGYMPTFIILGFVVFLGGIIGYQKLKKAFQNVDQ